MGKNNAPPLLDASHQQNDSPTNSKLLRSGLIVALFTLLSRFFGLAREFFIAYIFGTSQTADCVNVAFKFPNLFRRIFGEGALSSVFIPIYNEKLLMSKSEAKKFSGEVFTLLFLTLVAITIIIEILMPYLMILIAPGFYQDKSKFELAVILCRITTPYLIFISITAFFGAILNSVKKFAAFAFTPVIMNICIITVTYVLQENYATYYVMCYALIAAGILQVGFMLFCLHRAKLIFKVKFNLKDKSVIKLVKNMGPATLSSGAQQISLFITQSIASFLPGAIAILSYADRLYQLPLALIGITFSTILLPELSQIYKTKNYARANILQNKAIQVALFVSLPATFGLLSLSHPIIHLIYERGQFTSEDTTVTAQVLAWFSFGLPAYILAKIISIIYYANLDTKTPMHITFASLIINILLNIALMIPFGINGLAAGSSLSAWINVYLLYIYSKKYGDFKIIFETKYFAFKALIASIIMFCFINIISFYFSHLYYLDSSIIKIGFILGTILLGIIVFVLFSYLLGIHKVLFIKKEII